MNPNNVYINIIGLFWISNVTAIKVILNCFHIDSNSYHNSLTQIMIPTCQAKYHSNAVRIQLPLVLCRLAKPNLSLHVSLPIAFHPLCTDFVNIRKHLIKHPSLLYVLAYAVVHSQFRKTDKLFVYWNYVLKNIKEIILNHEKLFSSYSIRLCIIFIVLSYFTIWFHFNLLNV